MKNFPETITKLYNLKEINLGRNQITSLSEEIV
ncbi:hypothetical protein [Leptospira noguchii]|nr:hypothetical protein [Leptospira noguchii]UOG50143.1 hypothetical protein MAL00_07950 [Leptospira noguchii]